MYPAFPSINIITTRLLSLPSLISPVHQTFFTSQQNNVSI